MKKYIPIILLLLLLFIHLSLANDYGFTWDFHFHFFGGGKLLGIEPQVLEPRNLPFIEPDPRRAWTLPYGPLMSIPPVASYLFFFKTLGILPPDAAYHIPIILWGVAGIGILYTFLHEAFSARVALFGALFLALTPRFFGDTHNNMKDVPSAVIFALNIWLLWRLVKRKRLSDFLLAVLAFAVAFNIKINSIFIPIVFAAWLLLQKITRAKQYIPNTHQATKMKWGEVLNAGAWKFPFVWNVGLEIWYFAIAPLCALLLWSLFWTDPIGQLKHAYLTFGSGTNNIEVLLNGNWYCSGSTVPWYYPYWYLAITTPLPILIAFIIGLVSVFYTFFKTTKSEIAKIHRSTSMLLIVWFVLPLTRYFAPSVGVIDGIRHFEEVLFPLAALAGLGADSLIRYTKPIFSYCLLLIAYCLLFITIVSYHPYQITYFNELVGGVRGAMGKYDLDYWGTSQKAAVQWVNANAPPNAKVHIIMAAAVAGQYLRPDLLANLNKFGYEESDYVILLNRTSFLYRFYYAYEYLLHHKPVFTVSVRGAALTWVFSNDPKYKTSRQTPYWRGEDPCIIKYWRGERQ